MGCQIKDKFHCNKLLHKGAIYFVWFSYFLILDMESCYIRSNKIVLTI